MTRLSTSAEPIRVLHLITGSDAHPYLETIARHTDRRRFEHTAGTLEPPGPFQDDMARAGFATFSLGASGAGTYPLAALKLARRLRRDRVTVAQSHLLEASLVLLAAARLARTPLAIFTAHHSHEIPLYDSRRLQYAERAIVGPLCDVIIAPSRDVRDTLTETAGVSRGKIELIPYGFDLDRLDPARTRGLELRRELGLGDRVVFGGIGRAFWVKNYPNLVRAFAPLARERADIVLVLAGSGHEPALSDLARRLGIADRVMLVGQRNDVPDLLDMFDVFVHPAIAESFGMVLLEAMALGTPVVSTPVGIACDLLETGVTGVKAAGPEPPALEAALREALELRTAWPRMGAAARRLALDFPGEKMVSGYERCYIENLERRGRG